MYAVHVPIVQISNICVPLNIIAICAPLHMHGGAHVLETGNYMHHSITCV